MQTIGPSVAQAQCTLSPPTSYMQRQPPTSPADMRTTRDGLKHLDDADGWGTQPGPPYKRSKLRSFLHTLLSSCRSVPAPRPPPPTQSQWDIGRCNGSSLKTAVPPSKHCQPWLTCGPIRNFRDDQQAYRAARCCYQQQHHP